MSLHQEKLTTAEIDALLAQVATGAVAPKTAMALMLAHGEPRDQAARRVFQALGGGDAIDIDRFGRMYYGESGKLVADVERGIEEMDGL